MLQGGVTKTFGVTFVQVGQRGIAHAARQERGPGAPQAVAGDHLGEHPAGFGQALEACGPAAGFVGEQLHFFIHRAGTTGDGLAGSNGLVGDLPALPGGFLDGLDAALDHGNPGFQSAVLLFALGKVIERLPVRHLVRLRLSRLDRGVLH